MKITLKDIGRRFNRDWIFRGLDYTFSSNDTYAILGPNGSGKSTLLQVLTSSLSPSAGELNYYYDDKSVEIEDVYKHLSFAAPYLELIEEFTLSEVIDFHFKFKLYKPGLNRNEILDLLGMHNNKNKLVKYFSSGMKQRLKLALAVCAETPMLLLDEPTSNLDTQGTGWYLSLLQKYSSNRLIIISSNQEHEYDFCNNRITLSDYK